nr:hypothetical protein 8 [Candidatus Omnitrophota bacterium]
MATSVTVFSSSHCGPCRLVKDYLKRKGIAFITKEVDKDRQSLIEMVQRYQSSTTPTTIINGKIVIGFNRNRIDKLLGFM